MKDAEWIAELVRYGLIPPSFVPAWPLRTPRDLLRYRRALVEARSSCRNRVLKVLESANIKLASVASDVFGVSGMAMLRALVVGDKTPAEIAGLALGKLRKKLVQPELALEGSLGAEHRFMLGQLLEALDQEERRITATEKLIAQKLEPYRRQHELLTTIPGVDWTVAAIMIAEHGIAAFHILTTARPYRDLGGDYLDKRTEHRTKQRLIRRLERRGCHVSLQPAAA